MLWDGWVETPRGSKSTELTPAGVIADRPYALSSRKAGTMTSESAVVAPVSTVTHTIPSVRRKCDRLPRRIAACRATPTVRENRAVALDRAARDFARDIA